MNKGGGVVCQILHSGREHTVFTVLLVGLFCFLLVY